MVDWQYIYCESNNDGIDSYGYILYNTNTGSSLKTKNSLSAFSSTYFSFVSFVGIAGSNY